MIQKAIIIKTIGCKKCESLLKGIEGRAINWPVEVVTEGEDMGDLAIKLYEVSHFPTTVFLNEYGGVEYSTDSMLEAFNILTGKKRIL